jgi:hypothetical protein
MEGDEERPQKIRKFMKMAASICVASVLADMREERGEANYQQRLIWNKIIAAHGESDGFLRHLRMTRESFDQLLGYIREDLEVDEGMASLRGGPIMPELSLYCAIRWLAGGSYSDIYYFVGVSKASFYRVVWKTLEAIIRCQELQIKFPTTTEECQKASVGFTSISTGGAIRNCVSVIDGYLLEISTPSKNDVNSVRSFYSGHYKRNGVNIQATCDHLSRFTFFGVAGPGVMADSIAIGECGLDDLIENVPLGYVVIGDAAYKCSEKLVPLYSGMDRKIKKYDDFNYYGSQLRIRIEMAFGMMYRKWGILWRPVQVKVEKIRVLAVAIAMLHNYCINERVRQKLSVDPAVDDGVSTREAHVDESEHDASRQYTGLSFPNWSVIRENMVDVIASLRLERPGGNYRARRTRQVHVEDTNEDVVLEGVTVEEEAEEEN